MPELKFLPNEAGEGEGLSDAGIETYRADPFPAVARETGQNSRDAHDKELCAGKPVKVVIERLIVPTSSLPALAKYRETVRSCLELAIRRNRKKEKAFFEQAEKVLSQPQLAVLRISDSNTRGLRGPCVEGSPFHSLVKSSGVSNKADDTSGGSFGIGKSAVYSASDLQTVFYATTYVDESGNRVFLSQGKTKFTSFSDAAGKEFRSIGYWGEPSGYMPVVNPSVAPDWLNRSETGTTVCSIAVREAENWKKQTMASLLINFFSAVHRGEMEFNVDGEALTSRTLRHRFADPQVATAVRNREEDYRFAESMYECLTNQGDVIEHILPIAGVGTFRLRVIVKDGQPKRVGFLRNGMYICDNLAHFGDKFSRFPMYRDFVAMVEPSDDNANVWLRRMENPRHDEFSPERLLTPADRRAAARAGEGLAAAIRERIKEVAKPQAKDETELEEFSEFFATERGRDEDMKGERVLESFEVQPPPRSRSKRRTRAPLSDQLGGEGGRSEGGGEGGTKPGVGPGVGPGQGGTGKRGARRPFPLREPRTLIPEGADRTRRRILFTPEQSGEAFLRFESSGLSEPQHLETVPAECRVQCNAGVRQAIDVRFAAAYDGPIEVVSWSEQESARET